MCHLVWCRNDTRCDDNSRQSQLNSFSMLCDFNATCFGSYTRSHHQADKTQNKLLCKSHYVILHHWLTTIILTPCVCSSQRDVVPCKKKWKSQIIYELNCWRWSVTAWSLEICHLLFSFPSPFWVYLLLNVPIVSSSLYFTFHRI
jgi:hypothetical protein